ncbi:hypothetical protein SAMN00768000_3790 [Sulfobacillus thermosulfidooxidans DSM 9293]|uniref:Uncharacterized protein n=2 Tax=Sulfobacillus thermosulfidooxidans TaxID=28034 RepID=A0A1W1WR89_SULTA|nr:hypothetical protein SAMN00768000_3790 [Sulfobacillus thermosulfidooxidans DSM 9293]
MPGKGELYWNGSMMLNNTQIIWPLSHLMNDMLCFMDFINWNKWGPSGFRVCSVWYLTPRFNAKRLGMRRMRPVTKNFLRIVTLVGATPSTLNTPPLSLGGQFVAQGLADWPSAVGQSPVLSVIPLLVYLLASEERAVVSFSAHAQFYALGDEIGSILNDIVSDEKRHVRMIRHRLDRWQQDIAPARQIIETAEANVQAIRTQFLSTLSR